MNSVAEKAQIERTERARQALRDNLFLILPAPGGESWTVQNGDKEPYAVTHAGGAWACTCVDFTCMRSLGVTCKHIEAVRICLAEGQIVNSQLSQGGTTMSDNQMTLTNLTNGWVKLDHPAGVQVTLPVPLDQPVTDAQARAAMHSVDAYLLVGWKNPNAGLEQGETLEPITHLVRREKSGKDEEVTPLVDVYTGGNFRTLSVYLNTPEDEAAFQAAFGFPVADLPLFDGSAPIKRGDSPNIDKKYVRAVDGVGLVWSLNPKWEGEGDMKHQKRQFCRWERKVGSNQPAQAARRAYQDGSTVNGNEKEQAAFDRHLQAVGRVPASQDALREWLKANPVTAN